MNAPAKCLELGGAGRESPVHSESRALEDQGEQSLQDRVLERRELQRENSEVLRRVPVEYSTED